MSLHDNRSRLQQWQLAERLRYLAELESLVARLRGDAERLGEEIEAAALPAVAADRTTVYHLFVRPLIERRDKLARTIATIDAQIAETRAAVAAAEQEIKVYGEAGLRALGGLLHQRRRQRRRA